MSKAPCIPTHLPPTGIDWSGLAPLLGEASRELGRYDGLLDGMGNEEILLAPIITNEAVLSSRIEGTQASLGEVFRHEAGEDFDEHKRGDIFEVLNYRHALRLGEGSVREGAVSLVLIRQLHKELLHGVRGKDENPGAFRTNQNWIGESGCTIDEARFIPLQTLQSWATSVRRIRRPAVFLRVDRTATLAVHLMLAFNPTFRRYVEELGSEEIYQYTYGKQPAAPRGAAS